MAAICPRAWGLPLPSSCQSQWARLSTDPRLRSHGPGPESLCDPGQFLCLQRTVPASLAVVRTQGQGTESTGGGGQAGHPQRHMPEELGQGCQGQRPAQQARGLSQRAGSWHTVPSPAPEDTDGLEQAAGPTKWRQRAARSFSTSSPIQEGASWECQSSP
uniref:Uncharacterized protein n=1 Tax=Pipistrellus kuhlii TaxID=59472 RepID=A0A7J7UGE0_PIPKU|nr:hypothetical protein mPipKuh1_009099 [Pipistrellus kuhlii]